MSLPGVWRRGASRLASSRKGVPLPWRQTHRPRDPEQKVLFTKQLGQMGEPLDFWHHISSNLSFGSSGSSYLNQSPPSENIAALIQETKDPTEHPNLHTVPQSPHCGPEPVCRGVGRCQFLLHLRKSKLSQEKPRGLPPNAGSLVSQPGWFSPGGVKPAWLLASALGSVSSLSPDWHQLHLLQQQVFLDLLHSKEHGSL